MDEKEKKLLLAGVYLIAGGVFVVAMLLSLPFWMSVWGKVIVICSATVGAGTSVYALAKIAEHCFGGFQDASAFILEDSSRAELPEDEFKAELGRWRAAKLKAQQ